MPEVTTVKRVVLTALTLILALGVAGTGWAVSLAPPQRQWLAEHSQWRVGVVLQAPYAQLDSRAQRLSGFDIELVTALAQRLGVQLSWRSFDSQAALDHALRSGDIDLAPGLQQTPSGLRLWDYSDPYLRNPQRLIAQRGAKGLQAVEHIPAGSRVAVPGPGPTVEHLRTSYPGLELVQVTAPSVALAQLVAQQVEYAVLGDAQWGQLSGEPAFARLQVVGDMGLTQLLRLGTRQDWPLLGALVQTGLHAIPTWELEQLRKRWLQPGAAPPAGNPGAWPAFFAGALALAVVMGIALARQRRHMHQLERRLGDAREAHQAQAAREAALRLSQFSIDQSTVGILWVNWDSHLRYANRAAERLLGYAAGALEHLPLSRLDPTLDMDRWLGLWKQARAGQSLPLLETRCLRADGGSVPVDVALSFLRHGLEEYLVVFVTDVSERRRAQAQLRELSAHLESVREEEKARIAREVHDELGQVLTVLKLEISMCELGCGELAASARSPLQARLGNMKRLVNQLFQQMRDLATALRPPILDAGLASAVEWQATRFEARTGIPCLVQVPDQLPALSDTKATGLFRILQEALTNVMRHACAHSVEVRLSALGDQLELLVTDDGAGFDPGVQRPASFGLVGMRERVMLLGGQLSLHSRPGEGTSLYVRVPLSEKVAG